MTLLRPAAVPGALAVATLAAVSPARAHPVGVKITVGVYTHPTDPDVVLVESTFGLLVSRDRAETFQWVCERAFDDTNSDPVYAIDASGTFFIATNGGLRVSRDGGCDWQLSGPPLDGLTLTDVQVASDGTVWVTTGSPGGGNDVYRSVDGGASFEAMGLAAPRMWWNRVRPAPGDPSRVYATGQEFPLTESDAGSTWEDPIAHFAWSDDGGDTWTQRALDESDAALGEHPAFLLDGVAPDDPDVVFAHAAATVGVTGDTLYRSDDGGDTWTAVVEIGGPITAFVIRRDAQTVIAGARLREDGAEGGFVRISGDGGRTFTAPAVQPEMACLAEAADGALYACGANWAPDFFSLGRSSDAASWTNVYRFCETDAALACEAGTVQADCAGAEWDDLVELFGIGNCGVDIDAGPGVEPDAGAPDPPEGCGCRARDGGGGGAGLLVLLAAAVALTRRRVLPTA